MPDAPHENLPAVPETAVEEMIFDGEVVEETAAAAYPGAAVARAAVAYPVARTAARHLIYVGAGVIVLVRRHHLKRTRHERMMRAAEAAGDHETALAWAKQKEDERHHRGTQRVAMMRAVADLARALPVIGAAWLILMVVTGISLAVVRHRFADIEWPFMTLFRAVALAVEAVSVLVTAAAVAGPVLAVAGLYWLGRTAGPLAPSWVVGMRPEDDDRGLVVTADTIALALQNTPGIPALAKAVKDGWTPVFYQLPVRDGRGYALCHSTPLGVTAEMIADKRDVFARNVHRAAGEVWPTDAERAGIGPAGYVAWWIADPGVLDKAAPEYPLLHEGTADVFEGVPGGVIARGDEVRIPVAGNNMAAGGQMGQGKSNALRVYALGCALDPLCRIDVFVFANNGDFDAYEPRLAIYRKGVEDDTVAAAVDRLQELYEEVGRREARLAELGAKKVTRGLAQANRDMRPVVVLFSECHELFSHPEYGDVAAELAVKTIKRARKTAITLVFDTQSSRKEAIPPKLVELVSVNACFYVKTWRSNDGFLGDGSFAAGIRATELRPGRDRGTSVITGVSNEQFELLRWYFIEVDDDTGYDAAAEVIARAVAKAAPGTAIAANSPVAEIESRDLLDDLDAVIDGPVAVRLAELPPRLRKLAPGWGRYRNMTGKELAEWLDAEGVPWTNPKNVPTLKPADLQRVRAELRAERGELVGPDHRLARPGGGRDGLA